jgi:Ca-activated chloride channel family protein
MALKFDAGDVRLSMYALGELEGAERAEVEALLAENVEARAFVEDLRRAAGALENGLRGEAQPELSAAQRERVVRAAGKSASRRWIPYAIAAGIAIVSLEGWIAYVKQRQEGRALSVADVPELDVQRADPEPASPPALRFSPGSVQPFSGLSDGRAAGVPAESIDVRRQVERLKSLGYAGGGQENDLADSGESYATILESAFRFTRDDPLSTFSIDVDTASYANVRRFLMDGQRPPPDAVRIEELINYFDYDYPQPRGAAPFSVNTAVAECPWNREHLLLRIGLQGRAVHRHERNPSNLVFLVDVSGSMDDPRKLPLVVSSLRMLTEELDSRDRIAIVVYAGSSGLVLDSTSAKQRDSVLAALDRLRAGGSTNGGEGIQLAYSVARAHFERGGTNRVILCTDGDFNVGVTSHEALVELIESERKSGVFLSVLGFGTGNLKDSTMEQLADKGNGNYAYIDSLREARKVLVEQIGGTLETIAKDVKIQIELNPAKAQAWRLVGYENRVLAHQDFNDDTKDAGEIGAGHTVTALYEIVPVGVELREPGVDPLRYSQENEPAQAPLESRFESSAFDDELAFVKLRYKQPDGDESRLLSQPVLSTGDGFERGDVDFRFAAAVAAFGMKLRGSPHVERLSYADISRMASAAIGADVRGYRAEFLDLVRLAQELR